MKPPSFLDLSPGVESEFEVMLGAAEKREFSKLVSTPSEVDESSAVLLLFVYLTGETQGELFRGTNRHVATVVGAQDEPCEESKINPKNNMALFRGCRGEGKVRSEERERKS